MDHAVEHDGQTLADVFVGDAVEIGRALRVELHGDVRLAEPVGNLDLGGFQRRAGEQAFVFQQVRNLAPLAAGFVFPCAVGDDGAFRNIAAQGFIQRIFLVNDLEFQKRRFSDEVFSPFRILDARQLDHNAVFAFRNNFRLGNAELVHTVADGFDAVLHGQFFQIRGPFVFDAQGDHLSAFARCGRGNFQV